jgi:peptidoglycan-associated lipoprotein
MMEMLKFGKFAALSLALAVAVGCSSKGGDAAGEGAIDPNAGYGANSVLWTCTPKTCKAMALA